MKNKRWEVRLVGQGGQGLGLAGTVLAEAAIEDGNNAVINHFFGAQKRGGPSQADVIISTDEIDYPKVLQPDVLVIFSEEAFEECHQHLPEHGLVVVDTSHVRRALGGFPLVTAVPLSKLSEEATGSSLSANIVALGLVAERTKMVSRRALSQALRKLSPAGGLHANQTALKRGMEIAESLRTGGGGSGFGV
ncbi:MAG: 2-oxoacid:acceptor oxidoreductase family protein [Chloroflexota bacterium]|nr:2-oxoacid:acceptor oxidoreductase family protein [Chloroflexota bacterium]